MSITSELKVHRAYVPSLEINLDERLTFKQVRVLHALFFFRNDNTDLAWPSMLTLSKHARLCERDCQRTATELEHLGWLVKIHHPVNGRHVPNRYKLTIPPFITDRAIHLRYEKTLSQLQVGESPTSPPGESPTSPPGESPGAPPGESPGAPPGESPGQNYSLELPSGTKETPTRFALLSLLKNSGLSEETANELIQHRIMRKSPLTTASWQSMCVEAQQANISPSRMAREIIDNNWTRFKASWLPTTENSHGSHNKIDNSAPAKARRAIAEREARRQAQSVRVNDPDAIEGTFERCPF